MRARLPLVAPLAASGLLVWAGATPPLRAAPPTAWETRGLGGGGSLFAPSLSPHARDELYLACDMSDLFHSTDLGRSWALVDHRVAQGGHAARVQFTADPAVLYVINYRAIAGLDRAAPSISTDSGRSWSELQGDPTGGDAWHLEADPLDTDRVLVGDWNRLYFSSDRGATFHEVYADSTGNGAHVAGVWFEGVDIIVGTNAGLLVSTDGGGTVVPSPVGGIPADEAIVSMAGARSGATLRLFAVTLGAGDVYNGVTGSDHGGYRGVYTLEWGQPSWQLRTNGIRAGDHPFFVATSRDDVTTAYLGGGGDNGLPTVYRTGDGGLTWQSVFGATGNTNIATGWCGDGGDSGWGFGEYLFGLAVSPVDPARVAISDMGFVHVTSDGGSSWRQAYLDVADQNPPGSPTPRRRTYHGVGLEPTSAWDLTWSDRDHLFASFTDIRGTRSTDGGRSWSFDYSGHTLNTMYRVVRHPDGTLYGAASSVHDLYQSTYLQDGRIDGGRGQVLASADLGATWTLVHDFGAPVVWVALDPGAPDRLYAAAVHSARGDVYVSDDIQNGGASSWRRLASPPRTQGHPFNLVVLDDGTLVASYSGRRDASGAFTPSSGVFVSSDRGASWVDRSDPGMRYWTKDVVVDPHDPGQDTWYAGVFSGWGGPANDLGGLYRSRDRGASWTRIRTFHRVESITVSPVSPDEAYLTTETEGLWSTADLGAAVPTWTDTTYPFRHPVRVFFNPADANEVWVTSFGNGLRVGASPAAANVLRNTTVTQVSPELVPRLGTFMPLDGARDGYRSLGNGDLDPDGGIVADVTRPLTFYGLAGPGVLRLVKTPGLRLQLLF